MNTAAQLRALRLRPSIARTRPSLRPFRTPARPLSTATESEVTARSAATRTKNFIYGTVITLGLSLGYLYVTDTRASIHQWLAVPSLRYIYPDGEDAHHAGTAILKALYELGLYPRERGSPDAAGDLEVEIFGHVISNPIGTSAGIDKGAEIPTQLLALGGGIVEVGGVTPLPQPGNPKPRVFRLPSQNALINRYGFNSEGAEVVAMRLRQRVREFAYKLGLGTDAEAERKVLDGEAGVPPGSLIPGRLMAVQITKNKGTDENDIEAVKRDYAYCVQHLGKYADILVVNVSSPNTPGLRALQNVEPLTQLLTGVVQAVKSVDRKTKPAIMVKVSPDEDSEEQISGICEAVWDSGVDGVIVGNTTKKRPDPLPRGYALKKSEADVLLEQGGYSGPQMFERTLALTRRYRQALDKGPPRISNMLPAAEKSRPISGHATPDHPESSVLEKIENATAGQTPSATTRSTSTSTPTATNASSSQQQQPSNLPSESSQLSSNVDDISEAAPTLSLATTSSSNVAPAPGTHHTKVIFATGGITNGHQARQILDAGASVAMVYTALVYGGVGTITRIKEEMRAEGRGETVAEVRGTVRK